MKEYKIANGYVWGNCWGGGQCGYTARKISGNSIRDLKIKAEAGIKDGSLDSGMGYESLIGALLIIKIDDIRVIDGKKFINTSYKELRVGKLSRKVISHIRETIINN